MMAVQPFTQFSDHPLFLKVHLPIALPSKSKKPVDEHDTPKVNNTKTKHTHGSTGTATVT